MFEINRSAARKNNKTKQSASDHILWPLCRFVVCPFQFNLFATVSTFHFCVSGWCVCIMIDLSWSGGRGTTLRLHCSIYTRRGPSQNMFEEMDAFWVWVNVVRVDLSPLQLMLALNVLKSYDLVWVFNGHFLIRIIVSIDSNARIIGVFEKVWENFSNLISTLCRSDPNQVF